MKQLVYKLAGATTLAAVWTLGASAAGGHGPQADNNWQGRDRPVYAQTMHQPTDHSSKPDNYQKHNDYGQNQHNYQPVTKHDQQPKYVPPVKHEVQPVYDNHQHYQKPAEQPKYEYKNVHQNDNYGRNNHRDDHSYVKDDHQNVKHDNYQPHYDSNRNDHHDNYGRGGDVHVVYYSRHDNNYNRDDHQNVHHDYDQHHDNDRRHDNDRYRHNDRDNHDYGHGGNIWVASYSRYNACDYDFHNPRLNHMYDQLRLDSVHYMNDRHNHHDYDFHHDWNYGHSNRCDFNRPETHTYLRV